MTANTLTGLALDEEIFLQPQRSALDCTQHKSTVRRRSGWLNLRLKTVSTGLWPWDLILN